MKSGYRRGREKAYEEIGKFLVDTAKKSARASNTGELDGERLSDFDRGVMAGIAIAHRELAKSLADLGPDGPK